MVKYVVTRLIQGVLLLIVVSFLVFSLIHLMPGDPIRIIYGDEAFSKITPEKLAELRAEHGFDKPIYEQYLIWAKNAVKLDFGRSNITKMPVMKTLANRIPITLKLTGTSLLVQLLFAIPLGLLAAYKKDSIFDRGLMAFASFAQSIPNFWLGMLLILLFGVTLKWLPINGVGTWKHYVMPVIAISLAGIGNTSRIVKNEVLDVYREKYVQTAYAKGLRNRQVIVRHVLRNALILVVVVVFSSLPWLLSGSVIIENIFAIPGMGNIMVSSVSKKDFPVVQGSIMIITTLVIICNILSDLVTAALDPRIRIEISGGGK